MGSGPHPPPEAPSQACLPEAAHLASCAEVSPAALSQGTIHPRGLLIETMCVRPAEVAAAPEAGPGRGLWVPGGLGEEDQLTHSLPSWGDLPPHMHTPTDPELQP